MPLHPDRACPHEVFLAEVQVSRLADSGRFNAAVRVQCGECGEPFVFPASLPVGVDLSGITQDATGQELRVPVRPRVSMEELVSDE